MRGSFFQCLGIACVLACAASAAAQTNLGTSFTYQGQINQGTTPITGNADVQFEVFDVATGGAALGTAASLAVPVSAGQFTAAPDVGAIFDGRALWVEIAVRFPAGSGSYTTLLPRQLLTATPYALGLRLPLSETVAVPGDNAFRIVNSAFEGRGLLGLSSGIGGKGVYGSSTANGGVGVYGDCNASGIGVEGYHGASGNDGQLGTASAGVKGQTGGGNAHGVLGINTAVYNGVGVEGVHSVTGNTGDLAHPLYGVLGSAGNAASVGVRANHPSGSYGQMGTATNGAYAYAPFASASAVMGEKQIDSGTSNSRVFGHLGANLAYTPAAGVVGVGEVSAGVYTVFGHLGVPNAGNYPDLSYAGSFSAAAVSWNAGVYGTNRGDVNHYAGVIGYAGYQSALVNGYGVGLLGYSEVGTGVQATGFQYGLIAESTYLEGAAITAICPNPPIGGPYPNLAVFKSRAAGGVTNRARIDWSGKGYFNGGTQNSGADVAEAMKVEGEAGAYVPGDVLAISTQRDRSVARVAEAYSTLVAGVYATRPGVLLTEKQIDESLEGMVPVAIAGIVPTRVSAENGAIRRGDLLVSAATAGHAMKGTDRSRMLGAIIGKALQDFEGPGAGTIEVMVNVK